MQKKLPFMLLLALLWAIPSEAREIVWSAPMGFQAFCDKVVARVREERAPDCWRDIFLANFGEEISPEEYLALPREEQRKFEPRLGARYKVPDVYLAHPALMQELWDERGRADWAERELARAQERIRELEAALAEKDARIRALEAAQAETVQGRAVPPSREEGVQVASPLTERIAADDGAPPVVPVPDKPSPRMQGEEMSEFSVQNAEKEVRASAPPLAPQGPEKEESSAGEALRVESAPAEKAAVSTHAPLEAASGVITARLRENEDLRIEVTALRQQVRDLRALLHEVSAQRQRIARFCAPYAAQRAYSAPRYEGVISPPPPSPPSIEGEVRRRR